MGRIPTREVPFPSPGRPNSSKHHKSRKQAILKMLTKMSYHNHSQWAILMVDSKGKPTVETSEAFRDYRDTWFPENVIEEAIKTTVDVASVLKAQRRTEAEQNGHFGDKSTEGAAVIEDDDDSEDDAEHEDEDEPNDQSPALSKDMSQYPGIPPPPPSVYEALNPLARKRSLQMPKPQLHKKRRRSSVKAPPVQRSDSTSGESNAMATQSGTTYRPLVISDTEAVTTFFETRFRQMQQLTCKVVAKAWIKVIEPKKQSNFPYNRGEESKPSWWPEKARHKEPDHLMKPERLLLLMTMLRCGRVPIAKLEAATQEVSAHIEECRIGLLEEIYRVARMEERFVAGTLPPETFCYVAASVDKIVSNPKPQSPISTVDNPESSPAVTPPTSGKSLGPGMVAAVGSSEAVRSNNLDMQSRQTPRPSPTEREAPTRAQPNPFSMARTQPNIQPLQTPINFPQPLYNSTQGSGEDYMETPSSALGNYYFPRPAIAFPQPAPAPHTIRRAHSISHPQYTWPMPTSGSMFPSYNSTAQAHQHPHHSAHGTHPLSGSNPATPVTPGPFQPQLLPPPLSSVHQHQAQTSHGPSHSHDIAVTGAEDRAPQYDSTRMTPHQHMNHSSVSFSEFLESPIPERAFELGPVASGVGDDNLVGLERGRGPDGPIGIQNTKEMPHG